MEPLPANGQTAISGSRPTALVIAHPGHELRVHRWLELTRPVVHVLTDGSGHTGHSRLAATTALLARVGARPGAIYGRFSDRSLYGALLAGHHDLFAQLALQLAEALRREGIEFVAGDAVEGFNPVHDVCRLLLNAAVALLRLGGLAIENHDFPLEGPPAGVPAAEHADSLRIELDREALARKLAAARSYPGLEDEVEQTLARYGSAPFQTEWLRPVRYELAIDHLLAKPPYYELYGERQVAAGHYREVLRYRDHVATLAERLRCLATAAVTRAPTAR